MKTFLKYFLIVLFLLIIIAHLFAWFYSKDINYVINSSALITNFLVLFTAALAIKEYYLWKNKIAHAKKIDLLEKVVISFTELYEVFYQMYHPSVIMVNKRFEDRDTIKNDIDNNPNTIPWLIDFGQLAFQANHLDSYSRFMGLVPIFEAYFPENSSLFNEVEKLWEGPNEGFRAIPEYLDKEGQENGQFIEEVKNIFLPGVKPHIKKNTAIKKAQEIKQKLNLLFKNSVN